MSTVQPVLRTYFVVYVLLLVGVAATVGVAYIPLGVWNPVVALGIAFAKATFIVLFFMHVRYSPRLTWIVVSAGLVWLSILLAFVYADYATRDWIPTREPAQTGIYSDVD
jgi:cytochrome c oxidase subunit IV